MAAATTVICRDQPNNNYPQATPRTSPPRSSLFAGNCSAERNNNALRNRSQVSSHLLDLESPSSLAPPE